MDVVSRLEQYEQLDPIVSAGQRATGLIRPARLRDWLHGVWLGHPLHPVLVQVPTGAWLSAELLDVLGADESACRSLVAAGLVAAAPAALAGAADWSQQHEQQMRVGVAHAMANSLAVGCYAGSLLSRGKRAARMWRMFGLVATGIGGLLGGHMSFRLAAGANHAEQVPHLISPGWQHLMAADDLVDSKPVRVLLGEVPVIATRVHGQVHVLADRCSHLSGPLSEGELADGCITCPWHGSTFRLSDGAVIRGPATAQQPSFEAREVGGAIQVCLPDAG
jgi:nitrite reductase/ring-hydroxylating ferredoxin subunit